MTSPSRRKPEDVDRRAFRVALAVLVVGLSAMAAGLTWRVITLLRRPAESEARRDSSTRRPAPLVPDKVLNHTFPPNLDVPCEDVTNIYSVDGRGCRLVTNARGFKSRHTVAMPKPPGTLRIFFVGDSFVEGFCDNRLTMPEQVETRLQAAPEVGGRYRVEVMNAGVSAYSTMIYYLLVAQRLGVLAPDLVVINMDLTDVYDDSVYERIARYDDAGDLEGIGLFGQVTTQQEIVPGDPLDWARPGRHDDVAPAIARSLGWLQRTVAAARRAGAHVVVSLTPHLGQLGASPGGPLTDEPNRLVRAATEEDGAVYFDALGALATRSDGNPGRWYLEPGDNHFNIAGNEVWGEVFAEFLLAHADTLLQPAPSP